jgi:hypothetical protein
MSKRFTPPSAEELAARGLGPDGQPVKKKPVAKKVAPKKPKTEAEDSTDEEG